MILVFIKAFSSNMQVKSSNKIVSTFYIGELEGS